MTTSATTVPALAAYIKVWGAAVGLFELNYLFSTSLFSPHLSGSGSSFGTCCFSQGHGICRVSFVGCNVSSIDTEFTADVEIVRGRKHGKHIALKDILTLNLGFTGRSVKWKLNAH